MKGGNKSKTQKSSLLGEKSIEFYPFGRVLFEKTKPNPAFGWKS
jgi:hypothetical protein